MSALIDATLLVVDDDTELLDVLTDEVKLFVKTVHKAKNGKEALDVIQRGGIDAVLSDIRMPVMDGVALLGSLREQGIDTPFIVLTGHGDKPMVVECLRLGANDFLDKPWKHDLLENAVRRAISSGQKMRSLEDEIRAEMMSLGLAPEGSDELSRLVRDLRRKVYRGYSSLPEDSSS